MEIDTKRKVFPIKGKNNFTERWKKKASKKEEKPLSCEEPMFRETQAIQKRTRTKREVQAKKSIR